MRAAWKDIVATRFQDRASRLIAGIGTCVTLGLCALGLYLVRDLHDSVWRQAEQNATNLVGLVEHAVARNVELYDLSLRGATEEATTPRTQALDPALRRLVLFGRAAIAPGLGTMVISDAAGGLVTASDPSIPADLSIADRPEFASHRDGPDLGLIVAGPQVSRVSGRSIIALSRRISNGDGSFAGIVTGAIDLDYFQALFARLHIGSGSAVNLCLADGTLLVRSPYDAANVGRSIAAGEPYRRFQEARRGLFVSTSALDGTQRMYAFAHLDGVPLIVNVAVAVDSIGAVWRPKAAMIGVLVGALILVTLCLTILLQREVARRAAAEASSLSANAALATLASTDSLTGLPNRRRYDEVFAAEWRKAARTGAPLSLLVLDTDHFKRFNDHFGHHTGDAVLKAVAAQLRTILGSREGAVACRIGGEEFAVILPTVGQDKAKAVAERIRRAVAGLRIPHAPEIGGVATISIGVAHALPSAEAYPDLLFAAADVALYEAKNSGRNRVRMRSLVAPAGAAAKPVALSA